MLRYTGPVHIYWIRKAFQIGSNHLFELEEGKDDLCLPWRMHLTARQQLMNFYVNFIIIITIAYAQLLTLDMY